MSSLSVMVYETGLLEKSLPRLIEKVRQSGKRITLITGTQERALFIDQLLWTYTSLSFLPHGCQGQDPIPQDHPIWITFQDHHATLAPVVILVDTLQIPSDLQGVEKMLIFSLPQERAHVQHALQKFTPYSFWTQTDTGWKSIA